MRRAALLAGTSLCLGCSGAAAVSSASSGAEATETHAPLGFSSPARWDFHPAAPELVTARMKLQDGSCVLAALGGQRWTVTPQRSDAPGPRSQGGCLGRAAASSALAPEELVDVVRRSQSSWLFVGQSGTLYESSDPLGPFTRTLTSPEPFAKVTGGGARLFGVTLHGKLLRWDDGGWRDAPGAPAAGAAGVPRLFDIAVTDDGRALALAFPESLFTSIDAGATWSPAAAPRVGAQRVGVTARGELAAEGIATSVVWSPQRGGGFVEAAERLPEDRTDAEIEAGRAATATAVLSGRAVIDGDRYAEAVRPEQEGEPWLLARGRIEGRLEAAPIPGTERCEAVEIGASGRQLALACVAPSGAGAPVVEVRRSSDGGSTWSEPLGVHLETPSAEGLCVAVSPDGTTLLGGVCRRREATCAPGAPLVVRSDTGRATAEPASAPDLAELVIGPVFSVDGRSAYLLGRRGKNGRLALYVSHDAGASFGVRPLDPPGSGRPEGQTAEAEAAARDPEDQEEESESTDEFEVADESTLRPGEDGTLGMMLMRPRGAVWVTTTDDGRLLQVAYPDQEDAVIAGYGRRVLAVARQPSASSSSEDRLGVWESLDAGSSWNAVEPTPALARDFARGASTVVCGANGCLFGDTVSRVGWGAPAGAPPVAADAAAPDVKTTPVVRTVVTCELTGRWTRVDSVARPGARSAPSGDQILRGRSIWSLLTLDRASGAVRIVSATLPESGDGEPRIVTRSLFAAAPKNERIAMEISHQAEGYAALRVRVPVDASGRLRVGAPMKNLEVAWENFMEASGGRATIPDAGPFEAADVRTAPGRDLLSAALLSVSLRGVYVRPHHRDSSSSSSFFVEPSGKIETVPFPTWPERGLAGPLAVRSDMVHADGKHVAVAILQPPGAGNPTTVMLGQPSGSAAWKLSTTSLAPPATDTRPLVSLLEWTYSGRAIGLTTLVAEPRRSRAWAYFHPFRGDGTFGPPVPLATQLELGDRPRLCTPSERAATPRFESPLFGGGGGAPLYAGTRHPVLVTEPASAGARKTRGSSATEGSAKIEQAVLLTSTAVLHGTAVSPCIAGWEAAGIGPSASLSAVIAGDTGRSFLFRPVEGGSSPAGPSESTGRKPESTASTSIEVRPMSCRYDDAAKVPEGVWNEPATLRIER